MVRYIQSPKPDNIFAVEAWSADGNRLEETLATAGNLFLARAAFAEALRRYPERRILLRLATRVVADSFERR